MLGTPRECLRARLVDTGRREADWFDALSDGAVDAMAVGMGHAWVVESIVSSVYWAGGPPEIMSCWVRSPSEAVRFARAEDAAAVAVRILRPRETGVVGHMFD